MDWSALGLDLRNWATGVQALVAMAAIGVAAYFAGRRWQIFRTGQPHLTIDHEITHRRISPGYVLVAVTATLRNSSRVKVEVRDAQFEVQQIGPLSDEDVEVIVEEAEEDDAQEQRPRWDTLARVRMSWEEDGLIVEPGESASELFEYIARRELKSLLLITSFANLGVLGKIPNDGDLGKAPRQRRFILWYDRGPKRGPKAWTRTSAYDIVCP